MVNVLLDPVTKFIHELENCSGNLLLCHCCNTGITHSGEKIEIGISHHYRFTNPAGVSYSIGCFHNAPGCAIIGSPTLADSWFGGYQWQMAICSECQEHLGWYYQNSKQRFFFGLIKDRLITQGQ